MEPEEKSKDDIIESKGPLLESAIKDGVLTKAGEGFLKSNNIEIKNIKDIDEKESFDKPYLKELNGKKYIYVKKEKKGIETKKLFEENLENIIANIDFKKKMRWGDKDFAFVRPIRNIVALFGNEIIKTKIAGIETNNKITGHRLLSPEFVEINNPKDYEEYFKKIENKINSGLNVKKCVVATGGSVVFGKEAMEHFKKIGTVVYLKVSLDSLEKRLGDLDKRGVVHKPGETLMDIFNGRVPLYEKYADIIIDETHLEISQVARKIEAAIFYK